MKMILVNKNTFPDVQIPIDNVERIATSKPHTWQPYKCMLQIKLLFLLSQTEMSNPHSVLTDLPVGGSTNGKQQRLSALFQPGH